MTTTNHYVSILIIDDEPITRFIHQSLIGLLKVKTVCHEAANGKEALNLLTISGKPFPDIILLDLNMPLMDGFEFIEAFQKFDDAKDTTIVVVSSSINPTDIDRCRALGVDRNVTKPLMLSYLQNIITEIQTRRYGMVA